jgi:hypothetical protein
VFFKLETDHPIKKFANFFAPRLLAQSFCSSFELYHRAQCLSKEFRRAIIAITFEQGVFQTTDYTAFTDFFLCTDLKIVRHPEQSEGSSTRKQEIPRFARNDIFIVGGEHHS